MNIKRVGIDLAKQVLQMYGVDHQDKIILQRQLRRNQLLNFFATLPPCLIGMEGSLWWRASLGARIKEAGPYCKNDFAAVCEAVCEEQQERRQ